MPNRLLRLEIFSILSSAAWITDIVQFDNRSAIRIIGHTCFFTEVIPFVKVKVEMLDANLQIMCQSENDHFGNRKYRHDRRLNAILGEFYRTSTAPYRADNSDKCTNLCNNLDAVFVYSPTPGDHFVIYNDAGWRQNGCLILQKIGENVINGID